MKYEKRPIIDEDKVKGFTMTTDSGRHVRFEVYEGVIIFVSEKTSPDGAFVFRDSFNPLHNLRDCNPNWDEVAQTLVKCSHNNQCDKLCGMLNKNSEEYKSLKSAMEKCVAEKISKLEKKIHYWKSLLNKY